jgi:hypothetical protein
MNIRVWNALPRFAAIAALIVWGLTLPQLATFGGHLPGPSAMAVLIGIGLATLLTLLAQHPKLRISSLMLWLGGGVWTGAAYLSTEVIALAYFIVALLTIGSAAAREREWGKFSLFGPAAFIAAMVIMIVASDLLSG